MRGFPTYNEGAGLAVGVVIHGKRVGVFMPHQGRILLDKWAGLSQEFNLTDYRDPDAVQLSQCRLVSWSRLMFLGQAVVLEDVVIEFSGTG